MQKIRVCLSAHLNGNQKRIYSLYCCVYSFLCQTYDNFEIYIHHDGPLDDVSLKDKFESISSKIKFIDNLEQKKAWGHYHRHPTAMIEPHADWVLFTNDDNYYVPKFFEIMLNTAYNTGAGMVYSDMIHTDCNTPIPTHISVTPKPCHIDMGCFMSKMDIVKETDWNNFEAAADGIYAEKISQKTKSVKAPGILYIHN